MADVPQTQLVGLSAGLEWLFENEISLLKLNNEQDNIA